ncbi:MAG: sigma-70 family RNA polymerase sigma factor [Verrucomicrobia bacterium]|nr:sigma-70 family RNA polymerase sigma factor [Verrucomicrobiota bacterium]
MSLYLDGSAVFATTQWGLIVNSRDSSEEGETALQELCQTYWPPVYSYLRRHGYCIEDAQDLTQSFFAWILRKDWLQRVDHCRGKFRAILLTSLKNFVHDTEDRARAQKRGGHQEIISLDAVAGEGGYLSIRSKELTPEQAYDVGWAISLVEQTLSSLREEFRREKKEKVFDVLQQFLSAAPELSYEETAAALGIPVGTVKTTIYHLRQRYAAALRAEIARTLSDATNVDAEITYLCSVL